MINLVPPEIKKRKGVRSVVYIVTLAYITVVAALVLGGLGLATFNYIQKSSLNGKQTQLDDLIATENKDKDIVDQAAFIQNRVKNVATYSSAYDWNQVITAVATATPTNCQLTGLVVTGDASKPPTISLTGSCPDRRSIVLFEDKLNLDTTFSGASVTAISQSGTGFTFSISVGVNKPSKK